MSIILCLTAAEEWNATNVVRNNTKPEILLRAGRIIEPAKLSRAAKRQAEQSAAATGDNDEQRPSKMFKRSHANKKHKGR